MNDGLRMVRDELEKVLMEYGIRWEDSRTSRHNAIEYWVGDKRFLQTYAGGDPRARFNARSDLRAKLKLLGCEPITPPPKYETPEPEPKENGAMEEKTSTSETVRESWDIKEAVEPTTDPPHSEPHVEPLAKSAPPPETPLRLPQAASAHTYQSSHVLGIKLNHDLLVSAGNVLVIPLNRPNTVMEMTEEQFQFIFQQVTIEEPPPPVYVEPTPIRRTRAPRTIVDAEMASTEGGRPSDDIASIIAYLKSRKGAVKTEAVAIALNKTKKSIDGHMRRLVVRGIVESGPAGFWSLTVKAPTVLPDRLTPHRGRLPNGAPVPPQLGRILIAMAHVHRLTGKQDLSPPMVAPYLNPADNRQVGARMPGAMERGLVARGLPYPDRRGWHYKVTAKGYEIIKQVKDWPYIVDKQAVPEWLAQLQG